MKIKQLYLGIALTLAVACQTRGQTTGFTYQGRLNDGGNPANGSYDLTFALYDSVSSPTQQQGSTITKTAVAVSNGLFTVTLDFGDYFPGADRWLEIGVRLSGGGAFATLSPRQPLTATPYAVRAANAGTAASASSVAAANISGTIALGQLPNQVVTNGASGVNISGAFSGDGTGLTRLNTDALWRSRPPVVAWGVDGSHQTDVPPGLSNVKAVSAGAVHSLALNMDGTVVAWGAGTNSTSDPNDGQSVVPADLTCVKAIAAGYYHSLALKSNGTVIAWGRNIYGETNVPGGLSNVTAVAAGSVRNLALKSDGTVIGWGSGFDKDPNLGPPLVPPGLSNVAAIAAGADQCLALQSNGMVLVWGENESGQTNVPAGLSNVTAIASGAAHNLALKSDGTVVAWGAGLVNDGSYSINFGQSIVPAGLSNVVAIAAGGAFSLALKSDGSVVGWGENQAGQATAPVGLDGVIGIAAGGGHSLALRTQDAPAAIAFLKQSNTFQGPITATAFAGDGTGITNVNVESLSQPIGVVIEWTSPFDVSIPQGLRNVVSVSAGSGHDLALESDGTVDAWGNNLNGQCNVPPGLNNVIAVAAGVRHSLALKSDGTVVAWGENVYGETDVPPDLDGVIAIGAGYSFSLALRKDGTIRGWGLDCYNQDAFVGGISNIVAIAAGNVHSLVLRSDGIVFGLGSTNLGTNNFSQNYPPAGLSNVVAIAAGTRHSLALKSDGTVVAWGGDITGETDVPAGLKDVISIAAGAGSSLAMKRDGTVVEWGVSGTPELLPKAVFIAAGGLRGLIVEQQMIPAQVALLSENAAFKGSVSAGAISSSGNMAIQGTNTLEFGAGVRGKAADAGKIGYQALSADALDIVGAGTNVSSRKVHVFSEGGTTIDGDLAVNGNVGIGTATPDTSLTVATPVNSYGFEHTDGSRRLSSFLSGTGGWFGTVSPDPFYLFANDGAPALTIGTNGNVSIGTPFPGASALQINTPFHLPLSSGLQVNSEINGVDIQINRGPGGGGVGLLVDNSGAGDAGTSLLLLRNNVGSSLQTVLDVQADGKVGIQSSTPGKSLQVGDPVVIGSEGMIRLSSRTATGGAATRTWDIGVPQTGDNASGIGYSFVVNDAALGSSTPQLLVQWGTGNVGIGTTNPAAKLDVNGAVNAASFSGSGAALTGLNASSLSSGTVPDTRLSTNVSLLGQSIDSSKITPGTIVNANISATAGIADTKLATISTAGKVADSALSTNVALRAGGNTFNGPQIITNGNVGIGTNTPSTRLQVNGTVTATEVTVGDGNAYAAAADTPLRLMRGNVLPDGTKYLGSGFTSTRYALGSYAVTFTPPFSDTPTVIVQSGNNHSAFNGIDSNSALILIFSPTGASLDADFSFVAIGER